MLWIYYQLDKQIPIKKIHCLTEFKRPNHMGYGMKKMNEELQRLLPGISKGILTSQLRMEESNGSQRSV